MTKKKKQENIQFENELLKLKMKAETGASLQGSENLPPEIENEFMKSVLEFEKTYSQSAQTSVFNILHQPVVRNLRTIKRNELKSELKKLLDLYNANNIAIDCISEVNDRDLYRFLSEELMQHEMDDFALPGWITHFIYEEFHPNDKHDLESLTNDFIKSVLSNDKEFRFYETSVHETMKSKGKKNISSPKAIQLIEAFRNSYDHFGTCKISIGEVLFSKKRAAVKAHVTYKATLDHTELLFQGDAFLKFMNREPGFWVVSQFSIPGFSV